MYDLNYNCWDCSSSNIMRQLWALILVSFYIISDNVELLVREKGDRFSCKVCKDLLLVTIGQLEQLRGIIFDSGYKFIIFILMCLVKLIIKLVQSTLLF